MGKENENNYDDTYWVKNKLTQEDVDYINQKFDGKLNLIFDNSKDQDPNLIGQIDSRHQITILGGYDSYDHPEFDNKEFCDRTKYTPEEASKIISFFEEMEKSINPEWTTKQKALYVYQYLRSWIDIPQDKKERKKVNNLLAVIERKGNSEAVALAYKEAMDRLGIECNYSEIIGENSSHAWNEIIIDDEMYPLDLSYDIYRSRNQKGGGFDYFMNEGFYEKGAHKINNPNQDYKVAFISEEELLELLKSLDTPSLIKKEEEEDKPRESVEVKSKELAEIFKGGIVTEETIKETVKVPVKLSFSDTTDVKGLAHDIEEVARVYPELLQNVVLSNETTSHIDMQEVVNQVCESREISEKAGSSKKLPFRLTISSKNPEDFNLDLSNFPKVDKIESQDEVGDNFATVAFENTSGESIPFPKLNSKISKNVEKLVVDGFDFSSVDASYQTLDKDGIESLEIKGGNTIAIENVPGIYNSGRIIINGVTADEFEKFVHRVVPGNNRLFSLAVSNQVTTSVPNLFQELNSSSISFLNLSGLSHINLDGLDRFNDQLMKLYVHDSNLTPADLEKIENFRGNNRYFNFYLTSNSPIENNVDNVFNANPNAISDETYNYIKDYLDRSGHGKFRSIHYSTKSELVKNMTQLNMEDIPYYIQDAKSFREDFKLLNNPIMVQNDSELDSIDFTKSELNGANLLLTVSQIEKLIRDNKSIPQNVRIKISNVTELDNNKLQSLTNGARNVGINISGVQVIDNKSTHYNSIAPYTVSEYKQSREVLDAIVSGINPNDSELDKFTMVHQRLSKLIAYDRKVLDSNINTPQDARYEALNDDNSKNLINGLSKSSDYHTVCAGYSEILRNALALVGVEARNNVGFAYSDNTGGHAWNQVKIDGNWYNTDLTWMSERDSGRSNIDIIRNDPKKDWILRGDNYFTTGRPIGNGKNECHKASNTDREVCREDYNRDLLIASLERANAKSFDLEKELEKIRSKETAKTFYDVRPLREIIMTVYEIPDSEFSRIKNLPISEFVKKINLNTGLDENETLEFLNEIKAKFDEMKTKRDDDAKVRVLSELYALAEKKQQEKMATPENMVSSQDEANKTLDKYRKENALLKSSFDKAVYVYTGVPVNDARMRLTTNEYRDLRLKTFNRLSDMSQITHSFNATNSSQMCDLFNLTLHGNLDNNRTGDEIEVENNEPLVINRQKFTEFSITSLDPNQNREENDHENEEDNGHQEQDDDDNEHVSLLDRVRGIPSWFANMFNSLRERIPHFGQRHLDEATDETPVEPEPIEEQPQDEERQPQEEDSRPNNPPREESHDTDQNQRDDDGEER